MNRVFLIGRLGADPESRSFENGNSVASFSVATTRKYKNQQGDTIEDTQWHKCQAWGKQGEVVAQYCKKGHQIFVEGEIKYREHEGKYYTDINVNRVELLQNKESGGSQPQQPSPSPSPSPSKPMEVYEEDTPF